MSWDGHDDDDDSQRYQQCLVSREADGAVYQQYTWLPVDKAKEGASVKIKDDGQWTVWRVDIAFRQIVPGSYLDACRKARKKLT